MMLPLVVIQVINGYMPLYGLTVAFKGVDYSKGSILSLGQPWAGFENFKFLLTNSDIWRAFTNTVVYNVIFIIMGLVLAVALAVMLNEIRSVFMAKLYQTFAILPYFLSMVVVSYIVYALLAPEYGFINKIIEASGITAPQWYSRSDLWPGILFFTKMWSSVGYNSIIYLAVIAGIDASLYEAAMIDGATKWQQIRHITFPCLRSVVTIVLILSLAGIIKGDFGLFYQVTLNSPQLYPTTDVIDTYVYRSLIQLGDVGMSSALGFVQSLVGSILVISANFVVKLIDEEQAIF